MESSKFPNLPDPADFAGDLASLGRAVLTNLREIEATRVGTEWDALPVDHRELIELLWRYPLCRQEHLDTHRIFLLEAHRFAATKQFKQAGSNYKKWFDLEISFHEGADVNKLPLVRRKWSSIRANAGKTRVFVAREQGVELLPLVDACEAGEPFVTLGEEVVRQAIAISGNRNRRPLSVRELAGRIAEEMNVPVDTVRRILKPDADQKALSKLKR